RGGYGRGNSATHFGCVKLIAVIHLNEQRYPMEIKNNVFIVTGGASGLGAGTARMLTEQGAKVVIADLQDELGQALAKELGQHYIHCDVTSAEDAQATIDQAL